MKHTRKTSPVLVVAFALLVAVMVFCGYKIITITNNNITTEPLNPTNVSKTIVRNGVEYFPRQDINVFMLLGIDKEGPVTASNSYNNDGAADMIALAVFDETAKNYSVLLLNRDTMVTLPVLGVNGSPAGTITGQLALSHTYGKGVEDSCENVKKAVSDFLYGITIDHYISMNMDAISLLTDAVGGVKVTVTDDFSAVTPSIPLGETLLTGDLATTFVRGRKNVGNQLNISRIDRHKQFINGFMQAFNTKLNQSDSFVINAYQSVQDYIVTDTTATALSSMLSQYKDYELKEIITPEGENKFTGDYLEYYVDKDKLDTLVLNLFYAEKSI